METNLETIQEDLESKYSKYQLLPVLRKEFEDFLVENEIFEGDYNMHVDMLVQMYLHKQTDIVTIVGLLSPKHGEPQDVADKLLQAIELDLIDYDIDSGKCILKYEVSNDVEEKINLYQYPLPMVTRPEFVKSNTDTGYKAIRNLAILNGSEYFLDKDLCLDHVNRANSVALELNNKIVKSKEGEFIVPKQKPTETNTDYKSRLRQMKKFFNQSYQIMEYLSEVTDRIYLTHRYDRRGRCYASGYHVNSQGTDYNKAVLGLANKELIND